MIPPLEHQSLTKRIITTFIIVVVILFILSFIGWISGGWEAQGQAPEQELILLLPPTKWDARMDEMDLQALDEAYVAKVRQLIDVYIRQTIIDGNALEGAVKGHANAQRAYITARRSMEKKAELRALQREQKQ